MTPLQPDLISRLGETNAKALWDLSVEAVDLFHSLCAKHDIDCDFVLGNTGCAITQSDADYLMEHADPLKVMTKLAPLDKFEATVYDYHIADLYNGQLGWGPGSSQNTNGAGLLAGGSFNTFDLISGLQRRGSPNPYHVRRLLKRMEKKMWKQRRKGIVTIEEVEAPKEQPPKKQPPKNPH
jgi:hypothetical protein